MLCVLCFYIVNFESCVDCEMGGNGGFETAKTPASARVVDGNGGMSGSSTRVVVTFPSVQDRMDAVVPENVTVVKEYGRRLVLSLAGGYIPENDREWLMAAFNASDVEEDGYIAPEQFVYNFGSSLFGSRKRDLGGEDKAAVRRSVGDAVLGENETWVDDNGTLADDNASVIPENLGNPSVNLESPSVNLGNAGVNLENPGVNLGILSDSSVSAANLGTTGNDPAVTGNQFSAEETLLAFGQWNLMDSESFSVHPERVWNVTRGSPEQVVAVLDGGLPRISLGVFGSILPGYDFISDPEYGLDGDGRDDNYEDPGDSSPECPVSSWHGLQVTSVLAARG